MYQYLLKNQVERRGGRLTGTHKKMGVEKAIMPLLGGIFPV